MAALPATVAAYLRAHHVMTLATCGGAGPWGAAVFYAEDGTRFFFLSAAHTRHGGDLAQAARCAATIQDDVADWTQVRGVQIEGRAQRLAGDEARQAREVYGRKYPFVAETGRLPLAIAAALERVAWYRLDAEWLHFVDNSRGFGHRDSFDLR